MWWTCVKILLLCYFTEWKLAQCRQYDINAEAIKLYGEDLDMVLKRFRRTPEYLEILEKRLLELYEYHQDIGIQIVQTYQQKPLEKSINETLNKDFQDDKDKAKPKFRSGVYFDSYYPRLRADGDQSGNTTESTLSPAEILDTHKFLHSPFTAAERNIFKDLGFQVAGTAIHKWMEAMGPEEDEAEKRSTRMPTDDKKPVPTTENDGNQGQKKFRAAILRSEDANQSGGATYGYRLDKTTRKISLTTS